MTQLYAKFRQKIDWNNNEDWSKTGNVSFQNNADGLITLYKNSGSQSFVKRQILETGKKYRIKVTVTNYIDGTFVGGIKIITNNSQSYNINAVGTYSFLSAFISNDLFFTIYGDSNSKFGITSINIEELGFTELDTYQDESILLTFQVADIKEYDKRKGLISKDFTLPGTTLNNKFFKNLNEINNDNKFNVKCKTEGAISITDSKTIYGNIEVVDIIKNNNEIKYTVSFVGNNFNLFDDINDDDVINDLSPICTQLNHTATIANVVNSWTGSTNYVYPYINYGGNRIKSNVSPYTVYELDDLVGVYGVSTDLTPSCGITIKDVYPATRVKYIIDKIFKQYGYTYSSSFFNNDWFDELILLYNNEVEQLYSWNTVVKVVYTPTTTPLGLKPNVNCVDYVVPNYTNEDINYRDGEWMKYNADGISSLDVPNGINLTATGDKYRKYNATKANKSYNDGLNPNLYQSENMIPGTYLCKTKGKYKIKMKFKVSGFNSDSVSGVIVMASRINTAACEIETTRWRIMDNTDEETVIIRQPLNYSPQSNNALIHLNMTSYREVEQVFDCIEGDQIFFKFYNTGLGQTPSKVFIEYFEVQEYGWGQDVPVTAAKILSKTLKIKDFLKDIITMFNLYIDIDENEPKKLIIEPRDTYYSGGIVVDWSDKIDYSADIKIRHPKEFLNPINKLKYKGTDNDYYNNIYNEVFDVQKTGYGGKKFITENEFGSGENVVELNEFGNAVLRNGNKVGYIASAKTQFVTSTIYNAKTEEDLKNFKSKVDIAPIVMFFNYTAINNNAYALANKTMFNFCGTRYYSYPYAGHIRYPFDQTNANNIDLNFETRLYSDNLYQLMFDGSPVNTITQNNLFNLYYQNMVDEMDNINAKIVTYSAHLTAEDIAILSLKNTVLVDNTYYIINSIEDYNCNGNSLCNIELLKKNSNPPKQFYSWIDIDKEGDVYVNPYNYSNLTNYTNYNNDSDILNNLDNTVYNNDNVNINTTNVTNTSTGVTIINTSNYNVTDTNCVIIDGIKIKNGVIMEVNDILDGGCDSVLDPFTKRHSAFINDCGENNYSIFSDKLNIIIDGGCNQ